MTDDWDTEYGPGGPNQEWFERYIADVEQVSEEPIDDQFTFFRRLQRGPAGHFTVTQRLLDEVEDAYGPIGWARDWWGKTFAEALDYFEDRQSFAASPSVAPNREEIEEQRVARELVPLVRQAAAETPVGEVPRLDKDLARFRIFAQAGRRHTDDPPCWCGAIKWAGVAVHYDDRVPVGAVSELPKPWADANHDVLGDLQRPVSEHHHDCGCPQHSWWLP